MVNPPLEIAKVTASSFLPILRRLLSSLALSCLPSSPEALLLAAVFFAGTFLAAAFFAGGFFAAGFFAAAFLAGGLACFFAGLAGAFFAALATELAPPSSAPQQPGAFAFLPATAGFASGSDTAGTGVVSGAAPPLGLRPRLARGAASAPGAGVAAAAAAFPRPRFTGGGGGGGGGSYGFRKCMISVCERSLPSSSNRKASSRIFWYSGSCGGDAQLGHLRKRQLFLHLTPLPEEVLQLLIDRLLPRRQAEKQDGFPVLPW